MENRRQKRKAGYLSETQTKRGRFLAVSCLLCTEKII